MLRRGFEFVALASQLRRQETERVLVHAQFLERIPRNRLLRASQWLRAGRNKIQRLPLSYLER